MQTELYEVRGHQKNGNGASAMGNLCVGGIKSTTNISDGYMNFLCYGDMYYHFH